jgi:hypothetical protein
MHARMTACIRTTMGRFHCLEVLGVQSLALRLAKMKLILRGPDLEEAKNTAARSGSSATDRPGTSPFRAKTASVRHISAASPRFEVLSLMTARERPWSSFPVIMRFERLPILPLVTYASGCPPIMLARADRNYTSSNEI